jgi:hypothetical protein
MNPSPKPSKRPESLTAEERLTRIHTLERRIAQLERDLYWTKDELEGYRRWGEDRSAECRRAWDRCEEIWHEMNRLTVAFLKLTRTQRNQLAAQLGLDSGLADVDPHDVSNEILRRVREANKINELAEKLNHA